MATVVFRCRECGADLNLSAWHQYPPDTYFESGSKGTLSFSWVDDAKLRFQEEDKLRPFFETVNYWGIRRRRTRMLCDACGRLLGYVYDDGPPMMQGHGQFGFGPSQAIPRAPRWLLSSRQVQSLGNRPGSRNHLSSCREKQSGILNLRGFGNNARQVRKCLLVCRHSLSLQVALKGHLISRISAAASMDMAASFTGRDGIARKLKPSVEELPK